MIDVPNFQKRARRMSRLSLGLGLGLLVTATGGSAAGQQPGPGLRRQVVRRLHMTGGPGGMGDSTMAFSMFGDALAGKTVKGAPFTATAVTEMEQALADGNRIRQRSSNAVARDSAGRTRREITPGALGPLLAAGESQKLVHLHDPVNGTSVTLDENRKKAFKARRGPDGGPAIESHPPGSFELPLPPPGRAGEQKVVEEDVVVVRRPLAGGPLGPGPGGITMALPLMDGLPEDLPAPVREDLGSQTIEGVKADGTRSTITIPAGKVGNEKPLAIVSERWVSPDLGLTVLSRHSDPRLGTTTYRLTGIERREPPAALFETPAGYSVEEGPVLIRRRLPEALISAAALSCCRQGAAAAGGARQIGGQRARQRPGQQRRGAAFVLVLRRAGPRASRRQPARHRPQAGGGDHLQPHGHVDVVFALGQRPPAGAQHERQRQVRGIHRLAVQQHRRPLPRPLQDRLARVFGHPRVQPECPPPVQGHLDAQAPGQSQLDQAAQIGVQHIRQRDGHHRPLPGPFHPTLHPTRRPGRGGSEQQPQQAKRGPQPPQAAARQAAGGSPRDHTQQLMVSNS